MKQVLLGLAAVVVLAAVLVGIQVMTQPAPVVPAMEPIETVQQGQSTPMFGAVPAEEADADLMEEELAMPQPGLEESVPAEEAWQPDPDAVEALRQSRLHGDPRAPPIARSEFEREMPTEEELADPDLYLEYEARQEQKVYASFVEASKKKIADLEAIIERGRQGGVSPEQLAEGEEKLRRLKEMREQVLTEHPELAEAESADDGGEQTDDGEN